MTKIEKMYYDEKVAAVKEAVSKTKEEAEKEKEKEKEDIAKRFLSAGESVDRITSCMGLSRDKVEKLAESLDKSLVIA